MSVKEWQNYNTITEGLAANDTLLALNVSDHTDNAAGSVGQTTVASAAAALASVGGYVVALQPSGDTSGATDAAAIQSAYTGGAKLIRLLPTGTWYVECGIVVINASGVYVDATGCFISAVGAGTVFDIHDTSTFTTRAVHGGGIIGFPWIDGTSTTGNSTAVHMGDIFYARCDLRTANFTAGTTSKGAWYDNRYWYTEALHATVYADNCTAGVVFDVSAGNTNNTGSFMRSVLDLQVNQGAASNDGVVWQNGAYLQDGELNIRGNFGTSASALTSAVLRITGATPGGTAEADESSIVNSVLNMACELDTITGSDAPYSIYFGTGDNYILDCTGNIDLLATELPFQSSNSSGQFGGYIGIVTGDAALPVFLPAGSTNIADSNQVISATTATAITNVSAAAAAYTAYKIDIYIPHLGAGTTDTFTFGLGGPSIALASLDIEMWTGTTVTTHTLNSSSATLWGPLAASTSQRVLKVTGTIVFSAAGTVTVTGLKSVSGASNVTVDIGAHIVLTPLSAP